MLRSLEGSYAGIPQDSRLLYAALAGSPDIALTALLYRINRRPIGFGPHGSTPDMATQSSLLIQVLDDPPPDNVLERRIQRVKKVIEPFMPFAAKLNYIDPRAFAESLWDLSLSKSLTLEQRALTTQAKWALANFTDWDQVERTQRGGRPVTFDGSNFDFIVMQDVRYLHVTGGAQKLVRFHDAIPALYPQFVTAHHHRWFIDSFLASCSDSFFVCNSENTRREGELLFPGFAERSCVIPCAITEPPALDAAEQTDDLWNIIRRRSVVHDGEAPSGKPAPAVAAKPGAPERPAPLDYVLSVSTIETRKNYSTTVRAFEMLLREQPKAKLIVVGKTGGMTGDIMPAFKAHARRGNLIHLQNVSEAELRSLYRNARVLVFASLAEGFGLTPGEALTNGCPAIVSDIPTHREVYEDAAIYFDPRDPRALAAALKPFFAATVATREKQRAELLARGKRVLHRYRPAQLQAQWHALFERLRVERPMDRLSIGKPGVSPLKHARLGR
jgi:hypothetical protein